MTEPLLKDMLMHASAPVMQAHPMINLQGDHNLILTTTIRSALNSG